LTLTLTMMEMGGEPSQESMRGLIELFAGNRDLTRFVQALRLCLGGNIEFDCKSYARLLGVLMSRDASQAQVRAVLNMALSKNTETIPLVPVDLLPEEARAAFEDGQVALQEDGEDIEDEVEKLLQEAQALAKPKKGAASTGVWEEGEPLKEEEGALEFRGCSAWPELNGKYTVVDPMPEVLQHERPIYWKEASDVGPESEKGLSREMYAYFWADDPNTPWRTGWYLGAAS